MGFYPTTETFTKNIKKTLPGLDNFFMAGQWSLSTGGVLSSIYSGRHVVQLLCSKENKLFIAESYIVQPFPGIQISTAL